MTSFLRIPIQLQASNFPLSKESVKELILCFLTNTGYLFPLILLAGYKKGLKVPAILNFN